MSEREDLMPEPDSPAPSGEDVGSEPSSVEGIARIIGSLGADEPDDAGVNLDEPAGAPAEGPAGGAEAHGADDGKRRVRPQLFGWLKRSRAKGGAADSDEAAKVASQELQTQVLEPVGAHDAPVTESARSEAADAVQPEEPWLPDHSVSKPAWNGGPAPETSEGAVLSAEDFFAQSMPAAVDMGPAKRTRWWVWALTAVVVLAVAAATGYAWWWSTARPIDVPDVVGKRAAEAAQLLNDVGLRAGKVSEVPTDAAPVGTVIGQNPKAGVRLKPGSAVSFVIAAQPEQTKAPDVSGLSAEQAAIELARARLRAIEVGSYNATVAAGFVIAQLPLPGFELAPGSAVAVIVSRGPSPATVTVPRILGMQEGDALAFLKALGFDPRVYRSPDASIAAGVVSAQNPLPGTAAETSSVVQVLVSQGASTGTTVTVPDVVGKTRKEAERTLRARRLSPEVVVVTHPTVGRGLVISQLPAAGGTTAADEAVGLLVSRGSGTDVTVPSVVGTPSVEASAAIARVGLRPVLVPVEVDGHMPDTVIAQFPAAGATSTVRWPVVCLVARAKRP